MQKLKKHIKNFMETTPDRFFVISGFLLCILTLFAFYRPHISNDTSFMVLQGRKLLSEGLSFHGYTDNMTMHGGLLYYPQKWLMNLIVLGFYSMGGFTGLCIGSYVLCFIKTCMVFITVNCLNKGKPVFNAILSVSVIAMSMISFDLRPSVVSDCLILGLILVLEHYIKTGSKKILFFVPVISFFIMAVHSTMWILFVICIIPYLFEFHFIERLLHSAGITSIVAQNDYNKKPVVIAFLSGILAACLNPNGPYQFVYIFHLCTGIENSRFIAELCELSVENFSFKIWVAIMVLFVFSKIYEKVELRFAFFFTGGLFLMLMASRNFNYTILFTMLFLANSIKNGKSGKDFRNPCLAVPFAVFSTILCIFISCLFYQLNDADYKKGLRDEIGISVAEYCEKNMDKTAKIFNSYGVGATLELYGFKPYIDERSEVFDIQINKEKDILKEYYEFWKNPVEQWPKLQDKYGFDFVVETTGITFSTYLSDSMKYETVYSDEYYTVFKVR